MVMSIPSKATVIGGKGAGLASTERLVRIATSAARISRRQNAPVAGCLLRHACTIAFISASLRPSSPTILRHAPTDPPNPNASSANFPIWRSAAATSLTGVFFFSMRWARMR